jgi:hypothetical protein
MLAELDGSSVSADTTYTSSTGYLQVVFTSDRSVTRAGFVATWRATPMGAVDVSQQTPPPLPVPVTTPTPSTTPTVICVCLCIYTNTHTHARTTTAVHLTAGPHKADNLEQKYPLLSG